MTTVELKCPDKLCQEPKEDSFCYTCPFNPNNHSPEELRQRANERRNNEEKNK